jgi:hypothetical protein
MFVQKQECLVLYPLRHIKSIHTHLQNCIQKNSSFVLYIPVFRFWPFFIAKTRYIDVLAFH